MKPKEQLQPKSQEKPLAKAGWFIQVTAKQKDIYVGQQNMDEFRVLVDPDDNHDENVFTFMWLRGLAGKADWVETNISYSHPQKFDFDKKIYESVGLALKLPPMFQNDDFYQFADGAFKAWKAKIDQDRKSKKTTLNWRICPQLGDDEQVEMFLNLYPFNEEADKKDTISLYVEEDIPPNGYNKYGFKNGTEFANHLFDWVRSNWPNLIEFLTEYQRQDIPKLLEKSSKRMQEKPFGITHDTLRKLPGMKNVQSQWQRPDEGVEPNTVHSVGDLQIDKYVYPVTVIFRQNKNNYSFYEFIIAFPDQFQEIIQTDENQNTFGDALTQALDDLKENLSSSKSVFDSLPKEISLDANLVEITGDKRFIGFLLQLFGVTTKHLYDQGVSDAQIISGILECMRDFHPVLIRAEQIYQQNRRPNKAKR
jgi:hypothetical protein